MHFCAPTAGSIDSGITLLFEQQSRHIQGMQTWQHVPRYSQPQITKDGRNLCVYTAAQPAGNDDNEGSASSLCSGACAALRNKVA